MSITAVRLQDRDMRKGFGLRTYTSAATSTRYGVGQHGTPPPIRVIKHKGEIAELRAIEQFEIMSFPTMAALNEKVQNEMEIRARKGGSSARAEILGEVPADEPVSEEASGSTSLEGMPKARQIFGPLSDDKEDDDAGATEDEAPEPTGLPDRDPDAEEDVNENKAPPAPKAKVKNKAPAKKKKKTRK